MKTVLCSIMFILLTGCAATDWNQFGRALASSASTYGGTYNHYMAYDTPLDEVYTYQPTKVIAQPVIMGNGTTSGYTFIAR